MPGNCEGCVHLAGLLASIREVSFDRVVPGVSRWTLFRAKLYGVAGRCMGGSISYV